MTESAQKDFAPFSKKCNNDSKMKKFWTIICTSLLLLVPITFMYNTISERINYRNEAVQKVAQSWAGTQNISIPNMSFVTRNAQKEDVIEYLELNNYETNIVINTEIRKKGIFKVPVYTADVLQKGDFINNFGDLKGKKLTTKIAVTDARGFIEEPSFKIGDNPVVKSHDSACSTEVKSAKNIPFEIKYKIRGLNAIDVVLGGINNKLSIKGNWKDPEFKGDFLPTERNVTTKDFLAVWSVPKIALASTEAKQFFAGVSLLVPVDSYSMTERSLKYGFLLLILTFIGYYIFEITSSKEKQKVHPFQYCLLGAAILIFYLLLVSISELIAFAVAYLISALMVMGLVLFYTYFVITKKQSMGFSAGITALIGILYAYFYILLNLQDIALLAGSIGLFIIIAALMYFTRNVNWYNEK